MRPIAPVLGDHDNKVMKMKMKNSSPNNNSRSKSKSKRKSKRMRVVLFPCPYQGHLNPMMQLATLLHNKGGFSITIIHTRFNSPNPSNYPHFNFEPIYDGIINTSTSSSSGSTISSDIVDMLTALNVNCVDPFRDCLLRLLTSSSRTSESHIESINDDDEEVEDDIACIITDATMHFTQAVADSLQIPRIVFSPNSANSFLAFAAYPLLLQKGYLPIQDSELEKPVKELPPLKVMDLSVLGNTKNPDAYYELVAQIVEKTRSSSGFLLNTFESLEQPALDIIRRDFYPTPIFPIGPFHKYYSTSNSSSSLLPEDHSCITWLDNQAPKSVIYVSFGSLADVDEAELVETAWGLVNSGKPFLWVVRPGLVRRHGSSSSSTANDVVADDGGGRLMMLPDGLVELEDTIIKSGRGCLVKWAPQQQVLAHPAVGGFWTHCGWNSTLESVCEGVPMLCRPCFEDQMINARFVSDVWKNGFQYLDVDTASGRISTTPWRLERGQIERAIRRLMALQLRIDDNKTDDEMMKQVGQLKEKANLCLKEGGSSIQSIESLIHLIYDTGVSRFGPTI